MKKQFTNLFDLQKYFKTDAKCIKHLEQWRWQNGIACPHCGNTTYYTYADGKTYRCMAKECDSKFNVLIGTFFENTKLPLRKWFMAIYLVANHSKGISSVQLSHDIGVTQKTAWFLLHRIRGLFKSIDNTQLNGIVEADETYIGGVPSNKHASRKIEHGEHKTRAHQVVFGAIQRGGKVMAQHVPTKGKVYLWSAIDTMVEKGATLITDELTVYKNIQNYNHLVINHASKKYVQGSTHTQSIENFWSILKRGLYGVYHSVSPKHLNKYVTEFAARFNNRELSQLDRFNLFLSNCNGRLKYADLII
jgi:transposase-like protein